MVQRFYPDFDLIEIINGQFFELINEDQLVSYIADISLYIMIALGILMFLAVLGIVRFFGT